MTRKWEVLLGIRLLGATFWCGLSNHQAAAAQMHLANNAYRRVPILRSTSPFSYLTRAGASTQTCRAFAARGSRRGRRVRAGLPGPGRTRRRATRE